MKFQGEREVWKAFRHVSPASSCVLTSEKITKQHKHYEKVLLSAFYCCISLQGEKKLSIEFFIVILLWSCLVVEWATVKRSFMLHNLFLFLNFPYILNIFTKNYDSVTFNPTLSSSLFSTLKIMKFWNAWVFALRPSKRCDNRNGILKYDHFWLHKSTR